MTTERQSIVELEYMKSKDIGKIQIEEDEWCQVRQRTKHTETKMTNKCADIQNRNISVLTHLNLNIYKLSHEIK